jgi:hypothetical protein
MAGIAKVQAITTRTNHSHLFDPRSFLKRLITESSLSLSGERNKLSRQTDAQLRDDSALAQAEPRCSVMANHAKVLILRCGLIVPIRKRP